MDRGPAAAGMSRGAEPIAITGLGLVTALGASPDETFEAIVAGRHGLGPVPAMEQHEVAAKGGGQAVDIPDDAPRLSRAPRYLRFAILQAMMSARWPTARPLRTAVVMGTTLHGMRAAGKALRSGNLEELRFFPANAVIAQAVSGLGISGPAISSCSACSSGLGAVALGVTLLRAGQADVVIAGGYDVISEYAYAGFDSLRLIADGPPRPFGALREGMKTAEGFGVLILERAEGAGRRGAPARAYIAGFGETSDAHHLTQPHPGGVGAAEAMGTAIAMAGLPPEGIGLISAHATATINNDASEYEALRTVFGDALLNVPVVAFKSQLGHTLGGSGAVELVLSVLALERGVIPPTLNSSPIDPAFADLRIMDRARTNSTISAAINVSLGFGGANASVVTTRRLPVRHDQSRHAGAQAVITGIGVVLPGAAGADEFVGLIRGGSLCAEGSIREESIQVLLRARRVRRMSEYSKLTLAACTDACRRAGLERLPEAAQRISVILGTTHGSSNFCEQFYSEVVRNSLAAGNPVLFAEGVPNAAAAQLSLALGLRGGCQTIIGSRTSGLDALALAALRIREGHANCIIVGAAEEYCETVKEAHQICAAPGEAFGAGAVVLIVESQADAIARRARILATIGPVAWGYGRPLRALARVLAVAPRSCVTAFGNSPLDRNCLELIRRGGHDFQNLRPRLPELFSVGPLAALAARLLATDSSREPDGAASPFAVLATDGWGGATGLEIRVESSAIA